MMEMLFEEQKKEEN